MSTKYRERFVHAGSISTNETRGETSEVAHGDRLLNLSMQSPFRFVAYISDVLLLVTEPNQRWFEKSQPDFGKIAQKLGLFRPFKGTS